MLAFFICFPCTTSVSYSLLTFSIRPYVRPFRIPFMTKLFTPMCAVRGRSKHPLFDTPSGSSARGFIRRQRVSRRASTEERHLCREYFVTADDVACLPSAVSCHSYYAFAANPPRKVPEEDARETGDMYSGSAHAHN